MMNAQGVGRAGHFTLDANHTPLWNFDALPMTSNNLPFYDVPIRPLLSNEKLIANIFSGVMVQRTDKQAPTPSGGGSFSDADRAALADIQKKVTMLLKLQVGS
jgi:hypothetical protein